MAEGPISALSNAWRVVPGPLFLRSACAPPPLMGRRAPPLCLRHVGNASSASALWCAVWLGRFFPGTVFRAGARAINQVIDLDAFTPEQGPGRDGRLLCPVRALRAYVERTRPWRKVSQFFVCFGQTKLGQPASKQRLSHWLVDAITASYSEQGFPVPAGLVGHSTRSVATSWAALRGVSLSDICSAATWSSPCTFTRFYRLNVASATSLAGSVLTAGAQR